MKNKILNYLMDNFDFEGSNDIDALWDGLKDHIHCDDCVEFANLFVLLDLIPKELTQRILDGM